MSTFLAKTGHHNLNDVFHGKVPLSIPQHPLQKKHLRKKNKTDIIGKDNIYKT